jgi:hypothetical protein
MAVDQDAAERRFADDGVTAEVDRDVVGADDKAGGGRARQVGRSASRSG